MVNGRHAVTSGTGNAAPSTFTASSRERGGRAIEAADDPTMANSCLRRELRAARAREQNLLEFLRVANTGRVPGRRYAGAEAGNNLYPSFHKASTQSGNGAGTSAGNSGQTNKMTHSSSSQGAHPDANRPPTNQSAPMSYSRAVLQNTKVSASTATNAVHVDAGQTSSSTPAQFNKRSEYSSAAKPGNEKYMNVYSGSQSGVAADNKAYPFYDSDIGQAAHARYHQTDRYGYGDEVFERPDQRQDVYVYICPKHQCRISECCCGFGSERSYKEAASFSQTIDHEALSRRRSSSMTAKYVATSNADRGTDVYPESTGMQYGYRPQEAAAAEKALSRSYDSYAQSYYHEAVSGAGGMAAPMPDRNEKRFDPFRTRLRSASDACSTRDEFFDCTADAAISKQSRPVPRRQTFVGAGRPNFLYQFSAGAGASTTLAACPDENETDGDVNSKYTLF